MRLGLIAVGAAFAIVGAGVIAAIALTENGSQTARTGQALFEELAPSSNQTMPLPAVATADGSAEITWNSSAPAQVWWYAAVSCGTPPGWCLEGGILQNWTSAPAGQWSWHGAIPSFYAITVVVQGDHVANFTASFIESYPTSTHLLPEVPYVWTMIAGGLLVGIGGIAVYLGLFLPSGVYGDPDTEPSETDSWSEPTNPDYRFPPAR